MDSVPLLRFVIAGQLRREYILRADGKALVDIPGGNLMYAAAGLAVWEQGATGLLGRVGENYPQEWLERLEKNGFDRRGIRILPESIDLRSFIAYTDLETRHYDNPVAHFARLGLEIPKSLLGYVNPHPHIDSRTQMSPLSIRLSDIPDDYFDVNAVHLCPLDFLSHHLLPSALRQGSVTTITMDPSEGYMTPSFWDDVHVLVKDITAFLTSEAKLRALYQGRSTDLWEMAEDLSGNRCEMLVIRRGAHGQLLYEPGSRARWMIPAYPSRMADPTGAGDAFCGGFLAGYHATYDPIEAVLYGNVSSSLVVEGSQPSYAMETLPGLAQARLETLRPMARRM